MWKARSNASNAACNESERAGEPWTGRGGGCFCRARSHRRVFWGSAARRERKQIGRRGQEAEGGRIVKCDSHEERKGEWVGQGTSGSKQDSVENKNQRKRTKRGGEEGAGGKEKHGRM
eukprot:4532098-Pleurochrysis_carterae.AAC.8